ncbi:Endonuclease/Exonuclease/phosphatase family protein [Tritrichomonas foetus]|uniref:sphingomyelin phosphodiesterase n=1 Tax=Tritrichomonas foetus TaxID=1144522 RepID=A0A1J4K9R2_9EUKA|nr:Endonuclease/Exonuclease/phosphatase family protein [Tritrichomonas foetus]|eukprot:OHT07971.1 Endonuclease/Exonuclease/phosphatase family protein [Tritrichomonas foetus]
MDPLFEHDVYDFKEAETNKSGKISLHNKILIMILIIFGFLLGILIITFLVLKIMLLMTENIHEIISSNDAIILELPLENNNVKIIQYNVYWRSGIMHIGKNEYVHERAMTLSDSINDYDIICLSEAFQFGSSTVKHFIESLKARGFKYFVSGKKPSFFSHYLIDSGNLICSKYPIVETESFIFSQGKSFDYFGAKSVTFARIQISQTQCINVFTTHTQASYNNIITKTDLTIRSSQRKEIQQFMKKCATEKKDQKNDLTVLAGDLNSEFYDERENLRFLKDLQIDGYEIVDTIYDSLMNHRPYTTCKQFFKNDPHKKPDSIDYILIYQPLSENPIVSYSSRVEEYSMIGRPYNYLSDHYAITLDIKLE